MPFGVQLVGLYRCPIAAGKTAWLRGSLKRYRYGNPERSDSNIARVTHAKVSVDYGQLKGRAKPTRKGNQV